MVVSKKTIKDVMSVLERWRVNNVISKKEIAWLLDRLSQVEGNKSFTDTIKIMKENWDKWEGFKKGE